jgi:hypothetical protein
MPLRVQYEVRSAFRKENRRELVDWAINNTRVVCSDSKKDKGKMVWGVGLTHPCAKAIPYDVLSFRSNIFDSISLPVFSIETKGDLPLWSQGPLPREKIRAKPEEIKLASWT